MSPWCPGVRFTPTPTSVALAASLTMKKIQQEEVEKCKMMGCVQSKIIMPIQITSTTSTSSIGGVLEEWKALVQRESQAAYRLTGVEVEADRMALSSSPVSVSVDLPGEQDVGIGRACALAWHRENIVEWCYQIIDNW